MHDESIVLIPLTQGKVAIIDAEDAHRVLAFKWCAIRGGSKRQRWYAVTTIGGKSVQMHRFILDTPTGLMTDHRDGDGLNNRRDNLRIATATQNNANSPGHRVGMSGYRGVRPSGKGWGACISVNRKSTWLGTFSTPIDAARAYDEAARRLFGEFAVTNF